MLPDYPPARTSWLPASDRRSSPRRLCLLHPEVRAGAELWAEAAASLAALGERGADPVRARDRSRSREPGGRPGAHAARPAPRCGLAPETDALVAWLARRRCGPGG